MDNIEKVSLIRNESLSGEFYFTSLLEEAHRQNRISEADIQQIQMACLGLLSRKSEQYTGGMSSSVRVETAENIMKSNLYTIGLCLKSFPCPDDAVEALAHIGIFELYNRGRKLIDTKLKSTKLYHTAVVSSMTAVDNETYSGTLTDGIDSFFKLYNPEYGAHEVHITADYPLCNPVPDLTGIEFIQKYLESLKYENQFCRYFSEDKISNLLYGYDENYPELIFNLFESVLTCAIGCILVKIPAARLTISPVQMEQLACILIDQSKDEMDALVQTACATLLEQLEITSVPLTKYIHHALPKITSSIFAAIRIDHLESVFISPKYSKKHPQIVFEMPIKMPDELYRTLVENIMECEDAADKVKMIRQKVQSLADLEDLLTDAMLTPEEIGAVVGGLEPVELVVLAKRHLNQPDVDENELSEAEAVLAGCLRAHLASLPPEQHKQISEIMCVLVCKE